MKRFVFLAVSLFSSLQVSASEECANIDNDERRLACYDAEYQPSSTVSKESEWMVNQEVSPIDDSVSVYMRVFSKEPIPARFRGEGKAELWLRCQENTTSLLLNMAGHHMTSIQQYGRVVWRLDDDAARTISMTESTNNRSLGLWRGGVSIPEIKRMFDHDVLTVRATPFSESPITTQFPITGLKEAIKPLREACNW